MPCLLEFSILFFLFFFKKNIDKSMIMCYNISAEGEGSPKRKE